MSNTNQTVVNAIQAVNDERQAVVVAKGKSLIGYIESEAATIARLREEIKLHQEEIEKIAHTVIDFKSVTGRPAPTSPNVNEVTILKVITKLNEEKQKSVEVVAQKLADAVTQKQASIKATEQRIADLRKQLSELQAEVVTTTTVLG